MSIISICIWLLIVVGLIALSAFFSSSETGMMAVNRYRLRHLAKQGNKKAQRVNALLKRPDQLLGIILIGNTLCNVLASAIITYLVVTVFPGLNMLIVSLLLTLVLLIFAETAPKTFAAIFPQRVAFLVSGILTLLLKILYPIVVVVNVVANVWLRCFGIKVVNGQHDSMSAAELRSVVIDAKGKITSNYQQLLLRILELESVTVADVLVPRSEIDGIDLQEDWDTIKNQLMSCIYSHVVVYDGDADHIKGMLSMRQISKLMVKADVSKATLIAACEPPYFVPESAVLNKQLIYFQEQQRSISLVVDEYGDIVGLVTLKDIIEEIVGEFMFNVNEPLTEITLLKNGSVLVEGRMSLRELNRQMGWQLPLHGSRTLSGLIVEYLEAIPQAGVGCRIGGYPIEVIKVEGNTVQQARIWPELAKPETQDMQ